MKWNNKIAGFFHAYDPEGSPKPKGRTNFMHTVHGKGDGWTWAERWADFWNGDMAYGVGYAVKRFFMLLRRDWHRLRADVLSQAILEMHDRNVHLSYLCRTRPALELLSAYRANYEEMNRLHVKMQDNFGEANSIHFVWSHP